MQEFDVSIQEQLYIGMCDAYPSHLLPKGSFQLIRNGLVDNNKIFKRGGATSLFTAVGSLLPNGGFGYEKSNGTKEIIVNFNGASNARLYKWTGSGTATAIGTANLTNDTPMNFCQASDSLFGFNGVEVVDYDGTTVTKDRSGVPKGSFGVYFHNYLFVSGVSGLPDRVYFSNLGTPTTFTAADYVDINANDGDAVTGFGILNDELIIFKKYSIWSISGFSGATFGATTIAGQNTQLKAGGIGTPSHRSIIAIGRDLYYLSFNGNTPHFRSLNQTVFAKTIEQGVISWEIEGTMDGINKAQLSKCTGIYDGRYVHWAVPDGASTTNDLILSVNPTSSYKTTLGTFKPWSVHSGANISQFFVSTISGQSRIYGTSATANGKAYLFNDTSSYADDGTAVTLTIRTRDFLPDPARKSKYIYMYHKYLTGSAGTLTVNARAEKAADFGLQETVSLAGNSPGLGSFILGTSVLGGADLNTNRVTFAHLTGHTIGVEFIEATANSCELYDMQILGLKKGYRNS